MNNQRRKRINSVIEQLEALKIEIEELSEEENDALDNMPESIQYGSKGERMNDIIDNLDNAVSSIEEAVSELTESLE